MISNIGSCIEYELGMKRSSTSGSMMINMNKSVAEDEDNYQQKTMAATLKKVSSNLNRLSKHKIESDHQKISIPNSINFSLASRSGASKSKSREKSDIHSNNNNIKPSILDRLKKPQPPSKEDLAFKNPSFYNMLKKTSKANADKKISDSRISSNQVLSKNKIEAKASERVLQLIKNNYLASKSSKDPSSRESSNSVQRSAKDKSVKSKKSATDMIKKLPSAKNEIKIPHSHLFKGLPISEKPKSASKSVSRSVKDRKNTNSVSEKGEPHNTMKKGIVNRRIKTETTESSSLKKSNNKFDSISRDLGNHGVPSKQTPSVVVDPQSKTTNFRLMDMFKKMNLNVGEQETKNQKKDDVLNKQKVTKKEDHANKPDHGKKNNHIPSNTEQEIKQTVIKKQPKSLIPSITVKPSSLAFKDFGTGIIQVAASGPSPHTHSKKKKTGPNSGKRSPMMVSQEKDKRSTSNKRTTQLHSNVNVFSNNYMISHVHQVNNIYK